VRVRFSLERYLSELLCLGREDAVPIGGGRDLLKLPYAIDVGIKQTAKIEPLTIATAHIGHCQSASPILFAVAGQKLRPMLL
jgi:hypothetical protein